MKTSAIAIVSETKCLISTEESELIAAALLGQVKDIERTWGVSATIRAFDRKEAVPDSYWIIFVRDHALVQGDNGFHCAGDGRPYAIVPTKDGNLSDVCKSCSHEFVEMLIDSKGDYLRRSQRITGDGASEVDYLVEVCDPCQEDEYLVNDLPVSEFVLPAYFEHRTAQPNTDYSVRCALKGPRELSFGGYISWQDPSSKAWQFAFYANGLQGPISLNSHPMRNSCPNLTTRRWVDMQSGPVLEKYCHQNVDPTLQRIRQENAARKAARRQPRYNIGKIKL